MTILCDGSHSTYSEQRAARYARKQHGKRAHDHSIRIVLSFVDVVCFASFARISKAYFFFIHNSLDVLLFISFMNFFLILFEAASPRRFLSFCWRKNK